MENENRLNHLKHCFKEIFNDKTRKKWVQNIGLRETYDYLIRRAEKARTEQEFKYFTAILKRYVKMWKEDYEEHVMYLYMGDQRELLLWMEFELLYVEIPEGEEGDITTYNLDWAFSEHEITVKGKRYTVETYLEAVGFDYTYEIEY